MNTHLSWKDETPEAILPKEVIEVSSSLSSSLTSPSNMGFNLIDWDNFFSN